MVKSYEFYDIWDNLDLENRETAKGLYSKSIIYYNINYTILLYRYTYVID